MTKRIILECQATLDTHERIPKILFRPAYTGGFCNLQSCGFEDPVIFDMTGAEPLQVIPIVRDHDQNKKIGQTSKIDYLPDRLDANGDMLNLGIDSEAAKVLQLYKRGSKLQASIHTDLIHPDDQESISYGETVEINGKVFDGPAIIVRKWRLREISIVTVGANPGTIVEIEASLKHTNERNNMTRDQLSTILKIFGISKKNTKAKAAIAAIHAARAEEGQTTPKKTEEEKSQSAAAMEDDEIETKTAEAEDDDEQPKEVCASLDELLAALGIDIAQLTEEEIATLESIAAKSHTSLAEEGADEEKNKVAEAEDSDAPPDDEERTPAASLRGYTRRLASINSIKSRKNVIYTGSGSGLNACRVAEASLLQTGGVSPESLKRLGFSDQEIDQSMTYGRRNETAKSLCYKAGIANINSMNDPSQMIKNLEHATIKAQLNGLNTGRYRTGAAAGNLSNIDIPNIMANVMHKAMLVGQLAIDDPTDRLSKVVNATDFRQQLFYTMGVSGDFVDVKRNGELANLKLSDSPYYNTAKMRGFELRLPYEDIVNDNMGALTDAPQAMGRKAAIRKQKIWWDTLVTNLSSVGAVTSNPVLGIAGLDNMKKKLKSYKDTDGDPIGLRGRFLVVPPSLEVTALNIQNATQIVADGGETLAILPNANRLANTFETIASEFIGTDGVVSGWGDTAYMMLADPVDMPLMIVSYLSGQKSPTLKTVTGDYEIDGYKIGCWWGFGISFAEAKAAAYSSGAGK